MITGFGAALNEKGPYDTYRPFLVDKRIEISNLDLIREIVNIVKFEMVITEKG